MSRRRHLVRQGISLLEVLFAIGVVIVGLLGVAALIPAAAFQANKGNVALRARSTGLAAIRDIDVYRMRTPDMWLTLDLGNLNDTSDSQFVAVGPVAPPGRSFCIDPRFLALPQNQIEDPDGLPNTFPYVQSTDNNTQDIIINMPRITLRSQPLSTAGFMGIAQADHIFMGQDDLVFDLPKDRTLGPRQHYDEDTNNNPIKRTYDGAYSWMATFVPKLDRVSDNVTLPVPSADLYTMTIVVFHRRDAAREINDVNERVVCIPSFTFHSGGINGGDVGLVVRPFSNPARPKADLEVADGDWVLLSDLLGTSTGLVGVHQWYKVIAADPDSELVNYGAPINGQVWTRNVTLQGPDWGWDAAKPPKAQVTIVNGVVAVFEKTVRLDTSSLWTAPLTPGPVPGP